MSYLPYHELALENFFLWWDILVWVEGTIYSLDEENEELTAIIGELGQDLGAQGSSKFKAGIRTICRVLKEEETWTPGVKKELRAGLEYWENERRLCAVMAAHPCIPPCGHHYFAEELLLSTSRTKSFDYRVLHHLLCKLSRSEQGSKALFEFLALDEWLVDIGDDLCDYEDDVLRNSFNIYRGYVHLYGAGAREMLASHISNLEKQHAALLARLPPRQQAFFLLRKDEAAEHPGALRWVMPDLILDEAAYRRD